MFYSSFNQSGNNYQGRVRKIKNLNVSVLHSGDTTEKMGYESSKV